MTEYLARKEYTYQGGDAKFTIPFPYIDKTYIKVYVNGTATSGWTLLNESQLQVISPVLANGDSVVVARQTPITDKLVTFTDTSILNEDVQNLAQDQVFDAVQEIYDFTTFADGSIKTNMATTEEYKNQAATSAYNASVKAAETYATYQEAMSVIASTTQASITTIKSTGTSTTNSAKNSISAAGTSAINTINSTKTRAINEINSKLNTAKDYANRAIGWKFTYEPAGTEDCLVAIDRTQEEIDSAVSYVEQARDSAINSIGQAKNNAIGSVGAAATSATTSGTEAILATVNGVITSVQNAGTQATTSGVNSINAKATQGINSINAKATQATNNINSIIRSATSSIETSRQICEEMAQRATLGWNIEFENDNCITFTSLEE